MAKRYRFGFKRLDVYRLAVEHFEWTCRVAERMPKGPFAVVNQAVRASLSVVGNIGEAYGRASRPGEIEQHYRYAQGSAFEAATHLDALSALGVIDDDEYNAGEERLSRIAMMLTRLMQKQRRRKRAIQTARRAQEGGSANEGGRARQRGRAPEVGPPREGGRVREGDRAPEGGSPAREGDRARKGGLAYEHRPTREASLPDDPSVPRPPSNPREARPSGRAAAGRFDPPPGVAARAKRAPATEPPPRGAAAGGSNHDRAPQP
jgi:four helix bundle protein